VVGWEDAVSEAFKGAGGFLRRMLLSTVCHGCNARIVVNRKPRIFNSHPKLLAQVISAFCLTQRRRHQSKSRALASCYKVKYPLFYTCTLQPHSTASNASNMANSILLHEERFPSKTNWRVNAFNEEIHTGHLVGNEARLLVSFTHVLQ
jgi:hypothetical protein